MHFVFAVIIKMIMMFSPSISWAPSDKISLAFVESGRGAVSSKRLTWFLDLLRWESSGHCVFSPCSTDTVPFSCRVGNPNSQACVWPSIQFCLMCLQTSEREREKNLHHVVGKCESPTRLLYSNLSAPLPTLQEGEWVRVVFKFFMIWFNEFVGLNSLCFNEVITSGWGCW